MENIGEEVNKLYITAREAMENNKYDEAIAILQGLFELCSESPEAASFFGSSLGLCYLENNQPLQALLVLKKCSPDEDFNILRLHLYSLAWKVRGHIFMCHLIY
jgi:hypothetical protein